MIEIADNEFVRANNDYAWFPTVEACERLDIARFEGYHNLRYACLMNDGSNSNDYEHLPACAVEGGTIMDEGDNLLTLQAWDSLVALAREKGQNV